MKLSFDLTGIKIDVTIEDNVIDFIKKSINQILEDLKFDITEAEEAPIVAEEAIVEQVIEEAPVVEVETPIVTEEAPKASIYGEEFDYSAALLGVDVTTISDKQVRYVNLYKELKTNDDTIVPTIHLFEALLKIRTNLSYSDSKNSTAIPFSTLMSVLGLDTVEQRKYYDKISNKSDKKRRYNIKYNDAISILRQELNNNAGLNRAAETFNRYAKGTVETYVSVGEHVPTLPFVELPEEEAVMVEELDFDDLPF